MIEQKFTAGPWEWIGHDIEQAARDYKTVMGVEVSCSAYCYGGSVDMTISEADKRLICASTDMFEALSAVIKSSRLTTAEQALCAAALAKAMGMSIEEVIASQSI